MKVKFQNSNSNSKPPPQRAGTNKNSTKRCDDSQMKDGLSSANPENVIASRRGIGKTKVTSQTPYPEMTSLPDCLKQPSQANQTYLNINSENPEQTLPNLLNETNPDHTIPDKLNNHLQTHNNPKIYEFLNTPARAQLPLNQTKLGLSHTDSPPFPPQPDTFPPLAGTDLSPDTSLPISPPLSIDPFPSLIQRVLYSVPYSWIEKTKSSTHSPIATPAPVETSSTNNTKYTVTPSPHNDLKKRQTAMSIEEQQFLISTLTHLRGSNNRLPRGSSTQFYENIKTGCPSLIRFPKQTLFNRANALSKFRHDISAKIEKLNAEDTESNNNNNITICDDNNIILKKIEAKLIPIQIVNSPSENTYSQKFLNIDYSIRELLHKNYNNVKTIPINQRKRTQKYQHFNINWELINKLNDSSYSLFETTSDISEVIDIIYAIQLTYDSFSQDTINNKKKKSNIKQNSNIRQKPEFLVDMEKNITDMENDLKILILFSESKISSNSVIPIIKKIDPNTKTDLNLLSQNVLQLSEILKLRIQNMNTSLRNIENKHLVSKENRLFELNRGVFYKQKFTENKQACYGDKEIEGIKSFWGNIYKNNEDGNTHTWDELTDKDKNKNTEIEVILSKEELTNAVRALKNWAAPGIDNVYNFYIKYITNSHSKLLYFFQQFLSKEDQLPVQFIQARTLLLPKKNNPLPSEHRPIALLNTTFKLLTKIINNRLVEHIRENKDISQNQFAFLNPTLGCKEALLLDEVISKKLPSLNLIWLDIKKAFNSVHHSYLSKVLQNIKIPRSISMLISNIYSNAQTSIQVFTKNKLQTIHECQIEKGILQGDSLSPTLFMIALEPLSKELNKLNKISINNTSINHILYMDDIKIFAHTPENLLEIKNKTEEILRKISFTINNQKSGIHLHKYKNNYSPTENQITDQPTTSYPDDSDHEDMSCFPSKRLKPCSNRKFSKSKSCKASNQDILNLNSNSNSNQVANQQEIEYHTHETCQGEKGQLTYENNIQRIEDLINFPIVAEGKTYQYLGMPQGKLIDQKKGKERIIKEINRRITILGITRLNFKNLRTAINETCLTLVNYTVGILEWTQSELKEINKMMVKLLKDLKFQHRYSNSDRLFMKKDKGGLGIQDFIAIHNEQIITLHEKIGTKLNKHMEVIANEGKEIPSIIFKQYKRIVSKYTLVENNDGICLDEFKKNYSDIRENNTMEKKLHSVYFKGLEKACVDSKTSTHWLEKCETSPKVVSNLVALQDRTIFLNLMRNKEGTKVCPICQDRKVSIDHLATKCNRLLDRQYKRRHDNITKLIHFNILKKFGFKNTQSLAKHKPEGVTENEKAKVYFETTFTESKRHTNRPDMIIIDKEKKAIFLVEVGVTSPDCLKRREIEKRLKYSGLAKGIYGDTKMKTLVLPIVVSWDGLVTFNYKKNLEMLGLGHCSGYIQKSVLRNTFEICKVMMERTKI